MIIAFAFGIIGALLVLANSRALRKNRIFLTALILTALLAVLGIYFILNSSKKMDKSELFPMFSPLAAILFWFITRMIYKHKTRKEIIIHMYGLFPVRQDERYVTQAEKFITFTLLVLSVITPYIILKLVL